VRHRPEPEARVLVDHLAEAQDEVAGDAEDRVHPGLGQLVEDEPRERRVGGEAFDGALGGVRLGSGEPWKPV
jgi:hypothetical protein